MYFLLFLPFVVNKDYRYSFQPDRIPKNHQFLVVGCPKIFPTNVSWQMTDKLKKSA